MHRWFQMCFSFSDSNKTSAFCFLKTVNFNRTLAHMWRSVTGFSLCLCLKREWDGKIKLWKCEKQNIYENWTAALWNYSCLVLKGNTPYLNQHTTGFFSQSATRCQSKILFVPKHGGSSVRITDKQQSVKLLVLLEKQPFYTRGLLSC